MTKLNVKETKSHLKKIISCLTTHKKNNQKTPQFSFKEALLSIPKSNNNHDDFERVLGQTRNRNL